MEIQRCPRGHFYDADQNSKCPTCEREENGGGEFTMDSSLESSVFFNSEAGATEPVGPMASPAAFNPMPSFPQETETALDVNAAPAAGSYGATTPIGGFAPAPAAAPAAGNYGSTMPISPFGTASGADDGYGPTQPINIAAAVGQKNAANVPPVSIKMSMPVVGWLVCVEGNNKGADYRIHSQYNYIGRATHMDICITGDNYISSERAAVIAYDDMNKTFFFAPGMGTNIVRVNDVMVMSHVQLKPYDKIQIGMTKLVFVPFCGERFDWNA